MFVVRRRAGESVVVGCESALGRVVRVTVTAVSNGQVSLAFDANEDVSIEAIDGLTRRDIINSYAGSPPRGCHVNGQRRLLRKLDDARIYGSRPAPRFLPALNPHEAGPSTPRDSDAPAAADAPCRDHTKLHSHASADDGPALDSSGIVSAADGDCRCSTTPDGRRTTAS
jgi:sRNA-binding carbon storage regulator CsrA